VTPGSQKNITMFKAESMPGIKSASHAISSLIRCGRDGDASWATSTRFPTFIISADNFPIQITRRETMNDHRRGNGIRVYRGTTSLPIQPGTYKRIAVKIVDDQGKKA